MDSRDCPKGTLREFLLNSIIHRDRKAEIALMKLRM